MQTAEASRFWSGGGSVSFFLHFFRSQDKKQPLGHHVAENHRAGEKIRGDFQEPVESIRAYGRKDINELCGKREKREQDGIAKKQNPAGFAERQAEELSDQNVLGGKKGIHADSAQGERDINH